MTDYRIHIKVRNARLLRAIEKAGHQPGQIFAGEVGISYASHLLPYLNLKRTPFDENGDLRPCAEKLCVFLNRMPDELWSEAQRYPLVTNAAEIDLSAASVHELLAGPSGSADPLSVLEKQQAVQSVDALLDTLTPREAEVMRLRYGFDGEPMGLREIAKVNRVSTSRVMQIEAKALRKLRSPARHAEDVAALMGLVVEAA
jgi:RNA polymerase sigma factor (sigma-70 family)